MRPTPENQDAMPLARRGERNARRSERNAKGQYLAGVSGNPGGSPEATRRAFNKRFLLDLAEDWQQHGREVFKRVRRESPAAYLKVCAMLVPKEMQVEHKGGIKAMTDEQIEAAIEMIQGMLAAREAGADVKVIEGIAEQVSEPGPRRKTKRLADLTLTEPDDNGDNASPKGFERTGPPQDMGLATVNPSKSP